MKKKIKNLNPNLNPNQNPNSNQNPNPYPNLYPNPNGNGNGNKNPFYYPPTVQKEKEYNDAGNAKQAENKQQQFESDINHPPGNQPSQDQNKNQWDINNYNKFNQQNPNNPNFMGPQQHVHPENFPNFPNLQLNNNNINPNQQNKKEQSPNPRTSDPKIILGYRILKDLGSEFSASVHLVEKDHQNYAVKQYFIKEGDYSTKNDILETLFEREINIVKQMNHQNVIRYYVANKEKHVIIMEYMEGTSLQEFIRKLHPDFSKRGAPSPPVSEQLIKEIFFQIAMTLKYIHGKHIFHRDIKLENLLIKVIKDGIVVKLCDFGCSKVVDPNVVNASTRVGTETYMAPEMEDNEIGTHFTIDTWSLGVLIYYLCAKSVYLTLVSISSKGACKTHGTEP